MFLCRVLQADGRTALAVRQGREAALIKADPESLGTAQGLTMAGQLLRQGLGEPVDVEDLLAQGRLLPPVWVAQHVHLPLMGGELDLPLVQVPPGQPMLVAPGVTLEGGLAALSRAGGGVLGWAQFHLVTVAALGVRYLSFGPELALGPEPPPGGGTATLSNMDGTGHSFPLPLLPTGPDRMARDPTPAMTDPDPLEQESALTLRRLSRWLIRPAAAQALATLESRHVQSGLALRTPLRAAPPAA